MENSAGSLIYTKHCIKEAHKLTVKFHCMLESSCWIELVFPFCLPKLHVMLESVDCSLREKSREQNCILMKTLYCHVSACWWDAEQHLCVTGTIAFLALATRNFVVCRLAEASHGAALWVVLQSQICEEPGKYSEVTWACRTVEVLELEGVSGSHVVQPGISVRATHCQFLCAISGLESNEFNV